MGTNFPHCGSCDFFIWDYLKGQLQKRRFATIEGMKRAIAEQLKNVPKTRCNKILVILPSSGLRYPGWSHQEVSQSLVDYINKAIQNQSMLIIM